MNQKINNNEHSALFPAIQSYVCAFNTLATTMAKIKDKHGRKILQDITGFDVSRINTICGIGNLPLELCEGILPETLAEFLGEDKSSIRRHANLVKEKSLKASQVRKLLRQKNKTVYTKDKKVKVNNWGKNILLLENEFKNMDSETKKRALAHLTNTILTLK